MLEECTCLKIEDNIREQRYQQIMLVYPYAMGATSYRGGGGKIRPSFKR